MWETKWRVWQCQGGQGYGAWTPSHHQACRASWCLENQFDISWPGWQVHILCPANPFLGKCLVTDTWRQAWEYPQETFSRSKVIPWQESSQMLPICTMKTTKPSGRINHSYILSHEKRQVTKEYRSCGCIYVKSNGVWDDTLCQVGVAHTGCMIMSEQTRGGSHKSWGVVMSGQENRR